MRRSSISQEIAHLFGQRHSNLVADQPSAGFLSTFNMRALLPRERRRFSRREDAKGIVGNRAGRPHPNEARHARRRARRRAERLLNLKCAMQEPAGSKLLKRFARAAGFATWVEDGKVEYVRKPTAFEAAQWYASLEESPVLVGHQGYHPPQGRRARQPEALLVRG